MDKIKFHSNMYENLKNKDKLSLKEPVKTPPLVKHVLGPSLFVCVCLAVGSHTKPRWGEGFSTYLSSGPWSSVAACGSDICHRCTQDCSCILPCATSSMGLFLSF